MTIDLKDGRWEELVPNDKFVTKLQEFFGYCDAFDSNYHLPFAGEYVLGGKLTSLNDYRGVSDQVDTKSFDDKAVVLPHAGAGEINLVENTISSQRNKKLEKKHQKWQKLLELF